MQSQFDVERKKSCHLQKIWLIRCSRSFRTMVRMIKNQYITKGTCWYVERVVQKDSPCAPAPEIAFWVCFLNYSSASFDSINIDTVFCTIADVWRKHTYLAIIAYTHTSWPGNHVGERVQQTAIRCVDLHERFLFYRKKKKREKNYKMKNWKWNVVGLEMHRNT